MLWIGPTSSVFDITTYLVMSFIISRALVTVVKTLFGRRYGELLHEAVHRRFRMSAGSRSTRGCAQTPRPCAPLDLLLDDDWPVSTPARVGGKHVTLRRGLNGSGCGTAGDCAIRLYRLDSNSR
jgi:hypothetical protein